MRWLRGMLPVGVLLFAVACGQAVPILAPSSSPTSTSTASPSPSVSPTTSASPSASPTSGWPTYSDPSYGFSVQYPPNFAFYEDGPRETKEGSLQNLRFVDSSFPPDRYPRGQIILRVWVKDADSLETWVEKHSFDQCDSTGSPSAYFRFVSDVTSVTAADRPAVSFDWDTCDGIFHEVALFSGSRVITISWVADDGSYGPTLQPLHDKIVESFEDQ